MTGNVPGSARVKTIGWALYISPAVPLQVPVSGKVNCAVMGGERSPCSSAISRKFNGTHSPTEPIATWTPRVSCEPESDASAMDSVSFPCVHVIGAAPICVGVDVGDAVESADDDARASVDDAVELAAELTDAAVLVAKMSASGPSVELTTYVPPLP